VYKLPAGTPPTERVRIASDGDGSGSRANRTIPRPAKLLLSLFVEDRRLDAWGRFEDMWKDGVRVVLGSAPDRREREQWSSASYATKAAWRAAYLARGEAGACRGRTGLGRGERRGSAGCVSGWHGVARQGMAIATVKVHRRRVGPRKAFTFM
jgi:hypothetical protein